VSRRGLVGGGSIFYPMQQCLSTSMEEHISQARFGDIDMWLCTDCRSTNFRSKETDTAQCKKDKVSGADQ
jgi:hypothetical protein